MGSTDRQDTCSDKDFEPSVPSYRRHHWHEDDYARFESYIPGTETGVLEKAHHLYQRLHALPMSRDAYGLIHMDLHPWNFFYHDGEIVPFDFDDCLYSWFIADIATALYYITLIRRYFRNPKIGLTI